MGLAKTLFTAVILTVNAFFVILPLNIIKKHVLKLEFKGESVVLYYLSRFEDLIIRFYGLVYYSIYIFGIMHDGSDAKSPVKIALHKSYCDGFICNIIMPLSNFASSIVNDLPLVSHYNEYFENIIVDKNDKNSRVNAIYATYERIQIYKKLDGRVNSLLYYPEGFVISKDYMYNFKEGAFSGLEGVQPINIVYHKDILTNIDVSNARSFELDVILWLAKTYSMITIQFNTPLKYDCGNGTNMIDYNLPYDKLKQYIAANKEELKKKSSEFAKLTTTFYKQKYQNNIISDPMPYDGYDALNWYNYISRKFNVFENDFEIAKRGIKKEEQQNRVEIERVRRDVTRRKFIEWVDKDRMYILKKHKVDTKENYYRTNEMIKIDIDV